MQGRTVGARLIEIMAPTKAWPDLGYRDHFGPRTAMLDPFFTTYEKPRCPTIAAQGLGLAVLSLLLSVLFLNFGLLPALRAFDAAWRPDHLEDSQNWAPLVWNFVFLYVSPASISVVLPVLVPLIYCKKSERSGPISIWRVLFGLAALLFLGSVLFYVMEANEPFGDIGLGPAFDLFAPAIATFTVTGSVLYFWLKYMNRWLNQQG